MKYCKKCEEVKPYSEFSSHKTTADRYQNVCKKCINKNSSEYYARNKEKCAKHTKIWKAVNKDKVNLSTATRRKRVKTHKPLWAEDFFLEEAYRLSKLRTDITGVVWHVDHIIPLRGDTVCGLHTIENIQVIPATLNYKKSYYSSKEYSWSDCFGK